jgi:alpha-ketoglutarate-dependent taurine dioxygenase
VELEQLRAVLAARAVLVVRGGCRDVGEFAALCRGLGGLHDDTNGPGRGRPELVGAGIEVHYISNLDLAADVAMDGPTSMLSDANGQWHADYSWEPRPSRFTALFGIEIAAGGGAKTQLASTRRGFETLPADLQAWCHGRTVRHRPGGAHARDTAAANFAGTDHTAAGLRAAREAGSWQPRGAVLVDNHVVETVRRPLLARGALLLGRRA